MDSEKCWRRRLRKTISRPRSGARRGAWVACLIVALPGGRAGAEPEGAGVAALHGFLESVDTLTAEFEQYLYDADQMLLEQAEGSFALARPDRFVWHYRAPDEQIVLADGEQLWMYDVEFEQATVAPLDEGAGSPSMLLSGRGAVLDSFEIEAAYSLDGLQWVRLVPLEPGTDFISVSIGFDDEEQPRELEFVNNLNQTTQIVFSGVAVNEPLDDDVFELDLPDDVDVIGGGR